jgi:regulation of enolase protein 1 (concanavalin A-like superfamily)
VQAGQQQDDAYFGGAPVPNGNFATPGNYTVSAYYRTEAAPPADARFYIEILCYNSSNAYLSTVTSGDYSLTASWQRVIWFVTLPANTARVSVRFHYKRPRFSYWADGTWMNLSLTMLRSGWFYGRYADPDILQALPVKRYPSVEYHWGDTSKPNFSTTLGPLGQRNFVFDPSSRAGTYRTGLNATVAQVATGGADSDAFYRATYTGNSGQFASMGLYAKSWLNFPGDKHSFSAMARIPGGASRAVALEVDWYDKNDTLISWATSPDVVLGGDWTRVPLEGIYAPNNAYSVRIFVLVLNPQLGDMLDADMTFGTHSDTLPTYFDWRSPWAQPTNSANKDGGESILNSYKLYLTPRSYTDVWNAVKVKIPSSYPATTNDTDTMRLVMSYIDFDNQLFVGIESDGHAVITKRVRGVETRLVDSGNTFAWNAGQNYWLRGVLKQGKIICEIIQTNDITGLTAEYTVYGAWYYDLTSDEVAMFLTPASRIGLGIQFTAYGMAFDEWRYQSLAEPQGWKFYSGAGSVQVLNNTLRPLAPRPYLSGVQTPIPVVATLQGKTYNNPDLTAQIKQRIEIDPSYTNYTSGIVIKLLDKSNWIACYQSHFDGSNDVLNVDKCVNGVQSTLWSSSAMAMAKATNYWFRVTMTGNVIKIDRFVVDPGMGPATPQQTTTYTLTGADIAKFGTGVKGEFGIYWVPSMMQCSIDDFRFETGSYNTTAAAVKNAGNFPAQTRFELVGPMTNPVITNEATGQMAKINATIPAGETWVLEHKGYSKRLYRLSDGANRISYLDDTSQWIFISPNGVVNNIDLNASALSPGWDMVTYFQDTWM